MKFKSEQCPEFNSIQINREEKEEGEKWKRIKERVKERERKIDGERYGEKSRVK